MKWEKIFINHTSDNGWFSEYMKNYNSTIRVTTTKTL